MATRKVIGGMIPDPPWPAREACARWSHTNLGDIDSYPMLRETLEDVLIRFSRVVFSQVYPGAMTSGATESNLLALLYWRQKGKKRVLSTRGSHYSIQKAASILRMEYREYPINEILDKINREDVVVVTLGKTEDGGIDDFSILYDIVRKRNTVIHVDAAYFGTIAQYILKKKLYLDEHIATLAVDLHKIPEAPPPAGVLYAYNEDIMRDLWYDSPYIPGKRQFGILGTRPGCSVYAASVSLRIVVEEWPGGPRGLAEDLENMIHEISNKLMELDYKVEGGPAPIRCFKHHKIKKIRDYLYKKGYKVYSCKGNGIRIVAMPHNIWQGYKWIIRELTSAVQEG